MAKLDPSTPKFRYTLLVLNCLLTFGSYYCFDMPANLEQHIKDQVISGFTDDVNTYYNYFYLVYSWCNMIMSLCAGVMVDRLGKEKSMYLFVTFCIVGSAVYALGAALVDSDPMLRYIIMFAGRFIFGLGGGPITIVQNAFTAIHFNGHELAMAFGCTLTVSRVGSVVNFNVTPSLYDLFYDNVSEDYALAITLAVGSFLTCFSLIAAYYLARMDNYAQQTSQGAYRPDGSGGSFKTKKVALKDVKEFPALYWVLAITISIFYSIIFPFMADSSSFLQEDKFGLDDKSASFRASLVYMCSMVVSPFLGAFVDWIGRRTNIAFLGTSLTLPVFLLLADTSYDPIYAMLMLGISYSVCAAALWPSVQLLVPLHTVGTANGVATSVQMLGIGICNILVGYLRDQTSFVTTMMFFFSLGCGCVATVLLMYLLDHDKKMHLGKRDTENVGGEGALDPLLAKGQKEELV
mmetsp:Transcript_15280/g.31148  ORF Transcript_15280/g.31148 Transcript_15280/m.31148 type:complete len:463 (+) Transcript_15280:52-1440(+)|eukprot:CAMPEP_0197551656 /NCGR_PEP_ID=MMETSP1320-20131121/5191_1 /TAXON_ID=91990 /ORGANISM="Bolidomonas sp., Strain RCC2347" /LENGTH=462 /DNA_ID=CAMNT_0043112185 /DNA_START=36 /DNA_END=1424 /DNA_ORIENTATION=+